MRSLGLAAGSFLMMCAACGAGARYRTIGTGRTVVAGAPGATTHLDDAHPVEAPARGAAAVGPGADPTAGLAAAVALPADREDSTYKVDFSVWLPRAMEVDWTLRCGSSTRAGVIGEPFEHYRERRLIALRGMIDRDRRAAAAVGSLIGGAILGQVQAGAQVETAAARGEAGVAVDGAEVGAAVGAATVPDAPLELPAGDLGQGQRTGSVTLRVPEANAGACAMELAPREPGLGPDALAYLTGTFAVARLDDMARWQAMRAQQASIAVRVDLKARLVARGGDVELRWKRAEAARIARASADAERRRVALVAQAERARVAAAARAERERLALIARAERDRIALSAAAERTRVALAIQAGVLTARRSIIGTLTVRGADLHLRARREAEREAERARHDAECRGRATRAAAERETRVREERLQAEARIQLALDVRLRLRARLIGGGADPALRARLEAEAHAARLRRDAIATAEAAAALEAWRVGAELADQRARHAIDVRGQLAAQLTGRGAIVRPPMPAPVDELPGQPPAPGYAWAGGAWQWSGRDWRWMNGHWVGPVTGGAVVTTAVGGGAGVSIGGGAGVSIGGVTVTVGGSAGGGASPPPRPQQQDHRPAPRPRTQDRR